MSENAHGAPDHENETKAPPRVVRGAKLTEFRLAAGFLTILPVLPRAAVAPEIMRDSRIGSFGAAAIFFFLAFEIVALMTMGEARRTIALWLAPGLARWAMVTVGWRIEYLRAEGAGTLLLAPGGDRNLALASVLVALAALPVFSGRVLLAYVVAVALAAVLRAAYRLWLGGVTGDLLGAAGELVEVAVLLVMAAI